MKDVYAVASRILREGGLPYLTEENRQAWEDLVGFLASVSCTMDDSAKDNLIRMMESVFSQANELRKVKVSR